MTDWIQVLLGQPLEEAREDSLEELNQAADAVLVRKRQTLRRAGALEPEEETPAGEQTTAARLSAGSDLWRASAEQSGEAAEWTSVNGSFAAVRAVRRHEDQREQVDSEQNAKAVKMDDGLVRNAEGAREEAAVRPGAEQLDHSLRKARLTTAGTADRTGERNRSPSSSAGWQAARTAQGEALAWRQSGAETLEAETAEQQAELAAAEAIRRNGGGSEYLAAALASPEPRTTAAGRLLAAMEQNDRAAAYQTTARMTEQVENNAWTGSDPARLDLLFERDARRYDNGFTMF